MENSIVLNQNNSEIILYQPDETIQLEVRMEEDTVWLTQQQMMELFQSSRTNIVEHIKHIYTDKELDESSTCRNFRQVRKEGNRLVTREIPIYNLDMIISVGYRVNTIRGIQFRQWATHVLKEKLLHGSSHLYRIERLEHRMDNAEQQLDFFVKTSLPPVEGVFYNGQIFDAYSFASDLIKTAKEYIILIDNYIDESVLLMLAKRNVDVSAKIITKSISATLKLDLEKHKQQYPQIDVEQSSVYHDRFLIIDDTVYHLGASLKDLGKKLFAFSKLNLPVERSKENIRLAVQFQKGGKYYYNIEVNMKEPTPTRSNA